MQLVALYDSFSFSILADGPTLPVVEPLLFLLLPVLPVLKLGAGLPELSLLFLTT
jgi:hypothetical protein